MQVFGLLHGSQHQRTLHLDNTAAIETLVPRSAPLACKGLLCERGPCIDLLRKGFRELLLGRRSEVQDLFLGEACTDLT